MHEMPESPDDPERPDEEAGASRVESHERIFLVVVDETEEMHNALRFACRRAQHTRGRVALLYVVEPVEFQHWLGVGRMMEDEARQTAEQRMQALAAEVYQQTGSMPAVHIREGKTAEELLALLTEEPSISLLVLGVATGKSDPGPLVSYLTGNFNKTDLRVPLTLVPGHLTPDEIDALT